MLWEEDGIKKAKKWQFRCFWPGDWLHTDSTGKSGTSAIGRTGALPPLGHNWGLSCCQHQPGLPSSLPLGWCTNRSLQVKQKPIHYASTSSSVANLFPTWQGSDDSRSGGSLSISRWGSKMYCLGRVVAGVSDLAWGFQWDQLSCRSCFHLPQSRECVSAHVLGDLMPSPLSHNCTFCDGRLLIGGPLPASTFRCADRRGDGDEYGEQRYWSSSSMSLQTISSYAGGLVVFDRKFECATWLYSQRPY